MKDVEQGAFEPNSVTVNTEQDNGGRFWSNLNIKHLLLATVTVLIVVVGGVAVYAKVLSRTYIQLSKEDLSMLNNYNDLYSSSVSCVVPGSLARRCVYTLPTNLAKETQENEIGHAQNPTKSGDPALKRLDSKLWYERNGDYDQVKSFLQIQIVNLVFDDIVSSLGHIDRSVYFMTFLDYYSDVLPELQEGLKNQLLNIFTVNLPLYDSQYEKYYTLLNVGTAGFIYDVVELYVNSASKDKQHIYCNVNVEDLKKLNNNAFKFLTEGRLDGDIESFFVKFIVEMALALHYSNNKYNFTSINLTVLFAGLNFSRDTGMACCRDVQSVLPRISCSTEEIAFSKFIQDVDKKSLIQDYNGNNLANLSFVL